MPLDDQEPTSESRREDLDYTRRSGLLYCGLCGALNPSSNHYCARCGSTLVDAFHATEGMRVFQHPDDASRIVEIVSSGATLKVLPDDDAPADYARIQLEDGRIGYVKLSEVNRGASDQPVAPGSSLPDINTNARGCVTPGAMLASIALVVVLAALLFVVFTRGREEDTGIVLLFFCFTVVPLLVLLVALYVSARAHEDRLLAEEEEEGVA